MDPPEGSLVGTGVLGGQVWALRVRQNPDLSLTLNFVAGRTSRAISEMPDTLRVDALRGPSGPTFVYGAAPGTTASAHIIASDGRALLGTPSAFGDARRYRARFFVATVPAVTTSVVVHALDAKGRLTGDLPVPLDLLQQATSPPPETPAQRCTPRAQQSRTTSVFDRGTLQAVSVDTYDFCVKMMQLEPAPGSGVSAVYTFRNGEIVAKYVRDTVTYSPDGNQHHTVDGASPDVAPSRSAKVAPAP
jgi:hypothetical protein